MNRVFNLQMFLQAGRCLVCFLGLEAHEAQQGVVGWCQVIQSDGLALASIESPPLPGAKNGAKNPTKIRKGRGGDGGHNKGKKRRTKNTRWWFSISPLFGEDFQFDEHIFQMGWFNHQLVSVCRKCFKWSWVLPTYCLDKPEISGWLFNCRPKCTSLGVSFGGILPKSSRWSFKC